MSGLVCMMALAVAQADDCPNTEAFGHYVDTLIINNSAKVVTIICSTCYQCLDAEGYPSACWKECVFDQTIAPNQFFYAWDPVNLVWVLIRETGSCDDYTTIDCSC